MRRFLRSPLFFISLLTAVFLAASAYLYFDSPEDPGKSIQENPVLTRVDRMATQDGRFLNPISRRCKNRESRPAFAISLPETLSADVTLPEDASLEFAVGLKDPWAVAAQDAIILTVRAAQKIVFREEMSLGVLKSGWKQRAVDCSAFASRKIRLSFSFEKTGSGSSPEGANQMIFLSCPMLWGGSLEEYEGSIIFYLIDTLRADHLSCYGYHRRTSPHMDNLAGDGVLFLNLYAQAAWTGPSMATMFTSLYPSEHGFVDRDDRMSGDVETLAEVLSRAGYFTKGFVANGFVSADYNVNQGFDSYLSNPGLDLSGHARADEMVDLANDWLEKYQGRKFFLYIHTVDPHSPYDPPEPFRSEFQRGFRHRVTAGNDADSYKYAGDMEEEDIQYIQDLYDGEIAYSDHCFGRLVKKLKTLGLYEKTTIILISDHGEEFWENGGWGHGKNLFQHQLHIPLVIKFPENRGAGIAVKKRTQEIDIMPTLLEACDLPIPGEAEGEALYNAIFGTGKIPRREVHSETKKGEHRLYSLLDERYKYILRKEPVLQEGLYDIRQDPLEQRNLVHSKEAIKEKYRLEVEDFLSRRARGYHFLFPGGEDEDRVFIRMQGVRSITSVDFLGFPADEQEAWKVTPEKDGDITVSFKGLKDGREVIFLPGEENPFSVEIRINGAPLPEKAIRLGEGRKIPGRVPLMIEKKRVNGWIPLDGRPQIEERGIAACYIWAKNPEKDKASPTEENIKILEALGYLQ